MSFNRFSALARYIHFDDGRIHAQRLRDDEAAPISDVWNFINLARNYSPHGSITIGEQLFPYRGKPKFTQYISKYLLQGKTEITMIGVI